MPSFIKFGSEEKSFYDVYIAKDCISHVIQIDSLKSIVYFKDGRELKVSATSADLKKLNDDNENNGITLYHRLAKK